MFNVLKENLNYDNEMIAPQINDSFVERMVDILKDIRLEAKQWNGTSRDFFNYASVYQNVKRMDRLIEERFGWKAKHVYGDTFYATLPISFKSNHVFGTDFLYFYNMTKDAETKKELDDVRDFDRDEEAIMNFYNKAYDALEESAKTFKGVKIDLNKARIENLNDNFVIFYIVDFITLFREVDLTPEEVTAIILHEIGHDFTYLENSYRSTKYTTSIMQSIEREADKGEDGDVIRVVLEELGEDAENSKSIQGVVKAISGLSKRIEKIVYNNVNISRDSEQQADEFSSRFDMGEHLISSLNKIGDKYPIWKTYLSLYITIYIQAFITVILNLLASGAVHLIGVFAVKIAIILLILMILFIVMTHLLFGSQDAHSTTYDDEAQRNRRILINTIRMFREDKNLTREERKAVLDNIDNIISIIDIIKEDKLITEVLGDIMPWNSKKVEISKLERYIEELSENKLHIVAGKLELMS